MESCFAEEVKRIVCEHSKKSTDEDFEFAINNFL